MRCPRCNHHIVAIDSAIAVLTDVSKWQEIIAEVLLGPNYEATLREQIAKLKESSVAAAASVIADRDSNVPGEVAKPDDTVESLP